MRLGWQLPADAGGGKGMGAMWQRKFFAIEPVSLESTEVQTKATIFYRFSEAIKIFCVAVFSMVAVSLMPSVTEAAAYLHFECSRVEIGNGFVQLDGHLVNTGDRLAYVTKTEMSVRVTNARGGLVFQDRVFFPQVGVYVPQGSRIPHSFVIHGSRISAYRGPIRWKTNATIYFRQRM